MLVLEILCVVYKIFFHININPFSRVKEGQHML